MLLNTKLTTKISWYFCSVVFVWYFRLSALDHCTSMFQRGSPWNIKFLLGMEGLSIFLNIFGLFVNVVLPAPLPPCLHLTQCDGCPEDCMGAHGWVVGIAGHVLSRVSWSHWRPSDQGLKSS